MEACATILSALATTMFRNSLEPHNPTHMGVFKDSLGGDLLNSRMQKGVCWHLSATASRAHSSTIKKF